MRYSHKSLKFKARRDLENVTGFKNYSKCLNDGIYSLVDFMSVKTEEGY